MVYKIYIGGTCFPDYYNIESNTAQNSHPNGYYSSGDGDKFTNGVLDSQNSYHWQQVAIVQVLSNIKLMATIQELAIICLHQLSAEFQHTFTF